MPAIRAVCIRLAEMVADQRHYLAPLPEPQETERRTVLTLVADRLRSKPVTEGLEQHLKALEEMELRSTGSWSTVASAQTEWITTAIRYLEDCAASCPPASGPTPTGPTTSWRGSSPRRARSSASTSCTRAPRRGTRARSSG